MSELQAIMARRRKLADGVSAPPEEQQQPSRSAPRRTGSVRNKTRLFDAGGPPKPMQTDLQVIMERRRQMEESMEQETTTKAKGAETTVASSTAFFPSTHPKKQGDGDSVNVKSFFQQLQQEEVNDTARESENETAEAPQSPVVIAHEKAVPLSPPIASPPEAVPEPPKRVASKRWSRPAESESTAANKKWNPDGRRVSDRWNEDKSVPSAIAGRDAENTTPKRRVSDRWTAHNKNDTAEQSPVRQQESLQHEQQPKSPSFLQLQSAYQTSRRSDLWRRKSEASSIAPPVHDAAEPTNNPTADNSQPSSDTIIVGQDAMVQSTMKTKTDVEIPVEDFSEPPQQQMWRRKQNSVEPVLSPKQDDSWRRRGESVFTKDEERPSSTSRSIEPVLASKHDDSWQRKQESSVSAAPSATLLESRSEAVLSPTNEDTGSRRQSSTSRLVSATRNGPVLSPRNDDSWRKRTESAIPAEPAHERPASPTDRPLEDTSEPVLSPFQKIRQSFQPAPPLVTKANVEPKPQKAVKSCLAKSERLVADAPAGVQFSENNSIEKPEQNPVGDGTHFFDAFFPDDGRPGEAATAKDETTPSFPSVSASQLPRNTVASVELEKQLAVSVASQHDSSRPSTTNSEEHNGSSLHPLTSELSEAMPEGGAQLDETIEPLVLTTEEDFSGSLNFFENGSLPSVALTRSSSDPTEEALQTPSSTQENAENTQYSPENDAQSPLIDNTGMLETKYLGRQKKASPRRRRSSRLVDIVDTDAPLPSTRSMPDSGEDEKLPETTRRKSPRKNGPRKLTDTSPLDCLSSSDEPGFFSSGTDESDDRGLPKRSRQISRKRNSMSSKGSNNDGYAVRKRRTRSFDVDGEERSIDDTTVQNGFSHGSVDSSDCGDTTVTKPSASESSVEMQPRSGGDSVASTIVDRLTTEQNEVVDTDGVAVHGDDIVDDEQFAQSRDAAEEQSVTARDFFRSLAGHEETTDDTDQTKQGEEKAEVQNCPVDALVRQVSVTDSCTTLTCDQTSVPSKDDTTAENVHSVNDKEASQASAPHESRKPLHESFASFGNFSNIKFPFFEGPVVQADDKTEAEDTMRGSVGSFDGSFSRATEFTALPTTHVENTQAFENFDDCFADFDGDGFVNINKSAESFAPPHCGDADDPSPVFLSQDWDTSPIDQIPTLPRQETKMTKEVLLSSSFLTAPTSNPSNSHVIFATLLGAEVVLQEVDPRNNGVVLISEPLLSSALSQRVKEQHKATAHAIKTVWCLASGIDGHACQVVVIVDLLVLETSVPIRLLLVYEWAETQQNIKLSSVLSPPGGVDFVYDSLSLEVADGLLFLAGSSPRGSCIFVSNCAAEQPWNANYLETDSNVTAMETTNRQMNSLPLLVISLDDLSVIVWRYVVCDDSSRCLFPYCCLEYLSLVGSATSLSLPGEDDSAEADDFGCCQDMSFLAVDTASTPLLVLGLSFERGLAVFVLPLPSNIFLPGRIDFPEFTVVAETPSVSPLVLKKWNVLCEQSFIMWTDLGPYSDLAASVVLSQHDQSIVVVGSILLPSWYSPELLSRKLLDFCPVLIDVLIGESETPTAAVLDCNEEGTLIFSTNESLLKAKIDNSGLTFPITSVPFGLTSEGDELLLDAKNTSDGILHVSSVVQFESTRRGKTIELVYPLIQFWLCQTTLEERSSGSTAAYGETEGRDEVTAGARTKLVCELAHESLNGLRPQRLTRCPNKSICVVVFGPPAVKARNSGDETKVAFVDYRSESRIHVMDGRDVAFFPTDISEFVNGILLSGDGSSLSFFTLSESSLEISHETSSRPLLGIDNADAYVDCRRVFAFPGAESVNIGVLGRRLHDGCSCFSVGHLHEASSIRSESWRKLLPNSTFGKIVFGPDEHVQNLVGLQPDNEGFRNFCFATNARVLVASSSLVVEGECATGFGWTSITPIGAFSACYISASQMGYVSCLPQEVTSGIVGSFPSNLWGRRPCLGAVRQDRAVSLQITTEFRFIKPTEEQFDDVMIHCPITKPSFLIEPLIANAVSIARTQVIKDDSLISSLLGKFGRNAIPMVHGEGEGVGPSEGISASTLVMLENAGLHGAASWLITTNNEQCKRSSAARIGFPAIPVAGKGSKSATADAFLQLVTCGDPELAAYIQAPETSRVSSLPSTTSCVSYLSQEYAARALVAGQPDEALKTFDIPGHERTELCLLQLASNPQQSINPHGDTLVRAVSETMKGGASVSQTLFSTDSSFRGAENLSVSSQKRVSIFRVRNDLLPSCETAVSPSVDIEIPHSSNHIWNSGPDGDKASLLALDSIADWLSQCRPRTVGDDAAKARQAFADIFVDSYEETQDDFGSCDGPIDTFWVEGVGEGRSDEDNLSLYFRMSEGADTGARSKNQLFDLSKYGNCGQIVGDEGSFQLIQSTSAVDEGEPGKVKGIFDLVFLESGVGNETGLVVPVKRGSSLDVGVFAGKGRDERQKYTLEFWYFVPEEASQDIVLARRTMGDEASEPAAMFDSTNMQCSLWDIVRRSNGEIEFRTCDGSVLSPALSSDSDGEGTPCSSPSGRWNHICIVFLSRKLSVGECDVSIFLKGKPLSSGRVTFHMPEHLRSGTSSDAVTRDSHFVFAVDHCSGFRMTELRIWACQRSPKDIESFIYEYLSCAETRRKLRVNISESRTRKQITALPTSNQDGGLPSPAKSTGSSFSLAPSLSSKSGHGPILPSTQSTTKDPACSTPQVDPLPNHTARDDNGQGSIPDKKAGAERKYSENDEEIGLWDAAVPLSELMRPSTAAAFIRGPPATRHFGGNRGGLPDCLEALRMGVGGVAIAGPDRTVVWRDDPEPVVNSNPLGASGAIVSDIVPQEGSDFVCLFHAKERNIVVYKVTSQAVVVELEMTTKLGFWRFLPPETDGNSLCIMLITSAGGFHWRPLDENPQPKLIWKRGTELEGKKLVAYEEGGTNGREDIHMKSMLGLVMATNDGLFLEAWIVSVEDSTVPPKLLSDSVMGACLCLPPSNLSDSNAFLPVAAMVECEDTDAFVSIVTISEVSTGSFVATGVASNFVIDLSEYKTEVFAPPNLSMGTLPDALCLSLSNILVVIFRRKGLVVAFEIEAEGLSLIAEESVDHFVVDGVMRFSAELGGLELVMLLVDDLENKDGRVVSFSFRAVA